MKLIRYKLVPREQIDSLFVIMSRQIKAYIHPSGLQDVEFHDVLASVIVGYGFSVLEREADMVEVRIGHETLDTTSEGRAFEEEQVSGVDKRLEIRG